VPTKGKRRATTDRHAEIIRQYQALESIKDIAKELHLSATTVLDVLREHGIGRRSRGFRRVGLGKPAGPVRRVDGDAVVELYRQGLTQRQVAARWTAL
jgi:hypothetical protein